MFFCITSKQWLCERSPSRVSKRTNHLSGLCTTVVQISINHSGWLSVIVTNGDVGSYCALFWGTHKNVWCVLWGGSLYGAKVMFPRVWFVPSFDLLSVSVFSYHSSLPIHADSFINSAWRMPLKCHCRPPACRLCLQEQALRWGMWIWDPLAV